MNPTQYRQYLLAGTVSFPGVFPQLAELSLQTCSGAEGDECSAARGPWLVVKQYPAPRISLIRTVAIQDVRAVFLPDQCESISYDQGRWLLADEVLDGLAARLAERGQVYGIVYVPEAAPSLLEMSAGMTAAESIQYYPPLPRDPAHNHYNPLPMTANASMVLSERELSACEQQTQCELDESWPNPHWDDWQGDPSTLIACN